MAKRPRSDAPALELLPALESEDVLLVIGQRGTGKSTWAKAQVASWAEASPSLRVVAFDPRDEWSQLGRDSGHVTLGPLRQRMTIEELQEKPEVLGASDLSLAVVPTGKGRAALAQDLEDLYALLECTQDLVFVLDEVWLTAEHATETYGILATQSRHQGMPLVLISQWTTAIPISARRQATIIAAHRQYLPSDLDALAEVMGPDKAERVKRLPKYHRIVWREADELEDAPPPAAPHGRKPTEKTS